jgi:hypothetical protein
MPNPFATGHARNPACKIRVALGLELHDAPDDHARLSPVPDFVRERASVLAAGDRFVRVAGK